MRMENGEWRMDEAIESVCNDSAKCVQKVYAGLAEINRENVHSCVYYRAIRSLK